MTTGKKYTEGISFFALLSLDVSHFFQRQPCRELQSASNKQVMNLMNWVLISVIFIPRWGLTSRSLKQVIV